MKLKKEDVFVLCVIFVAVFWLWTLPFQSNHLPFSEHDGAYIFSYGDHITFLGRTMNLQGDVPPSIVHWYAGYNKIFGPWGINYPPPYNIDYSLMQIVGGERIIPVFIFIAFGSVLGVFSMYLLMRKLFGFLPAVITSTALMFSFREILSYLWGQRHNTFAFVFVPIAIYAFYKMLSSYYNEDRKQYITYFYIFVSLFASSALIHFSVTVFLAIYCLVLLLIYIIKYKKLPFDKTAWRHYLAILVLFFALTAVMYPIYFSSADLSEASSYRFKNFGSIFKWIDVPDDNFLMNPIFTSYTANYISKWTILLLLIGIVSLLMTKGDKKWVILSGVIALYILYHMPFLGLIEANNYRIARAMMIETYFFYAIMAIALVKIPDFFPIDKKSRKYIKYLFSAAFIILLIFTQGAKAYDTLKNSYNGVMRITPAQFELSSWVENNIPPGNEVNILGTITYPKYRWIQILSRRGMFQDYEFLYKGEIRQKIDDWPEIFTPVEHIIFDYSDLVALGDRQKIDALQQKEQQVSENATLVYDKNYIRVYKFD